MQRQERSLVVQTSQLGDAILTTPLLARLAKRGPVDVVTTRRCAALLRHNPDIRRLIVYDKNDRHRGLIALLRFASHLRRLQERRDRYTAAYLAQGSIRSATLTMLAGVRERIGFDTSAGAKLYTRTVQYRSGDHHVLRLWHLGGPGTPGARDLTPRLFPSRSDVERADELLAGCVSGLPIYALAPGSRRGTKRWPYYDRLAHGIAGRANVVVLGGEEDRTTGEAIRSARGGGATLNLAGVASPLTAAAVLRRATVLVSNDSAAQHMAAAFSVPVVVVFGPTLPEWGFGPLSPDSTALEPPALSCRPCAREAPHRCPHGHWRCMTQTEPDAVARLVDELASRSLPRVVP